VWEFFSNVLETGGVVALLFALVLFAFAATVKALWNQNQKLHAEIRRLQEECKDELNTLQEKRVGEAQAVTEVVLRSVEATKRGMEKVEKAMDVLIDLSGRGPRR
jgi:predicted Holliday junction resolvase-like endonuclease